MDTSLPRATPDIAEETYKGPGKVVTAAGEAFLVHFFWMAAGLLAGGAAAFFAHKKVGHIEKSLSDFYLRDRENPGRMTRFLAKSAGLIGTITKAVSDHLPGSTWMKSKIPAERVEAVVFGAGILGAIGYVGSSILAIFSGAKHANEGKDQFERLKEEVLDLRGENDALRDKYIEEKVAHETTIPAHHPAHHEAPTHAHHEAEHTHTVHEHAAHRETPKPTLSEVDAHSHGKLVAPHETALG